MRLPKTTPASAPAGQDGGTGSTTPAGNSLKPDAAPAAPPAPTQATPGKTGNGADPGKASPVADGTPVIAVPERGGMHQNAENPISPPHKPAASAPAVRAEQVPN